MSNPAAMVAKQSIRAVRGPDGNMIFSGLLPGGYCLCVCFSRERSGWKVWKPAFHWTSS